MCPELGHKFGPKNGAENWSKIETQIRSKETEPKIDPKLKHKFGPKTGLKSGPIIGATKIHSQTVGVTSCGRVFVSKKSPKTGP